MSSCSIYDRRGSSSSAADTLSLVPSEDLDTTFIYLAPVLFDSEERLSTTCTTALWDRPAKVDSKETVEQLAMERERANLLRAPPLRGPMQDWAEKELGGLEDELPGSLPKSSSTSRLRNIFRGPPLSSPAKGKRLPPLPPKLSSAPLSPPRTTTSSLFRPSPSPSPTLSATFGGGTTTTRLTLAQPLLSDDLEEHEHEELHITFPATSSGSSSPGPLPPRPYLRRELSHQPSLPNLSALSLPCANSADSSTPSSSTTSLPHHKSKPSWFRRQHKHELNQSSGRQSYCTSSSSISSLASLAFSVPAASRSHSISTSHSHFLSNSTNASHCRKPSIPEAALNALVSLGRRSQSVDLSDDELRSWKRNGETKLVPAVEEREVEMEVLEEYGDAPRLPDASPSEPFSFPSLPSPEPTPPVLADDLEAPKIFRFPQPLPPTPPPDAEPTPVAAAPSEDDPEVVESALAAAAFLSSTDPPSLRPTPRSPRRAPPRPKPPLSPGSGSGLNPPPRPRKSPARTVVPAPRRLISSSAWMQISLSANARAAGGSGGTRSGSGGGSGRRSARRVASERGGEGGSGEREEKVEEGKEDAKDEVAREEVAREEEKDAGLDTPPPSSPVMLFWGQGTVQSFALIGTPAHQQPTLAQSTAAPARATIPTTLILDFHDSYTRNLLSLFSQLPDLQPDRIDGGNATVWSSERWQERVVVVNVDSLTWDVFTHDILPYISCVILGPGPGSPHKAADFSWPKRLILEFGDVLPIWGVCLGHQGLATAFGGDVVKAPAPIHGQVSQIRHAQDELFAGVPEVFGAVQFNSLVVKTSTLPAELEAIGWAMNKGEENIMALRHRTRPLWGVQFHPESIASTFGTTLLSNFLELATTHRQRLTPSFNPSLAIPLRLQSLTTSYKRGLPNAIPDVPSVSPHFAPHNWHWEQRSVDLGSPSLSPQEVFEGYIKGSSPLGEVWLDSARPTVSPQFSHLFTPQLTWSHSHPSNTILVRTSATASSTLPLLPPQTFFSTLGTAQGMLKRLTSIDDPSKPSVPIGFVGYLAYEMKEVTLPLCEPANADGAERTDAEFAFVSTVLSCQHDTGRWRATALVRVEGGPDDSALVEAATSSRFGLDEAEYKSWLSSVHQFFASSTRPAPTPSSSHQPLSIDLLTPDLPESAYKLAIEAARQSIIAGDAYELCLTTQFRASLPAALAADPYPLYLTLRTANPAPYSSYFRLPLSSISLLSSSPERFMQIGKEGRVEMKPIKGTVRRSADPVEDERRRVALERDEKERAENLMIVDLCRHDLAGFCEAGSVEVPKLMVVESYQTVHQLVTSVVGQLAPVVNPFEAVARAFPPGSMTGAPKLRSVQLLEELEGHRPRGVYSGVFGFVAVDGTTDFSVVIRTLVIKGTELTLGAGGAITHLSEVANEWEEVLVKTEAVVGRAKT